MKYPIQITQVFRVQKSLVLEVEAPNEDEAVRIVDEREIDIPTADDDKDNLWSTDYWFLQNEEVIAL